jgi:hypothetical protein
MTGTRTLWAHVFSVSRLITILTISLALAVPPKLTGEGPPSRQTTGVASAQDANPPTFLPVVTYGSGGTYAYFVAVADVNGDGKLDLLVADCGPGVFCGGGIDGVIGVLLGNSDGTFQPVVTYDAGGFGTNSIAIADVNGDGKPDIVLTNSYFSNTVGVLLGNGDGTFQPVVTYSSGGGGPSSVAIADVNGDGKPDILVANGSSCYGCTDTGLVGVLLGNGDGTFQPAVTYDAGGYGTGSLAIADLNGDGKLDVAVTNGCGNSQACSQNGSVGVLLGNGDGTFQPVVTYDAGALLPNAIKVADMNGDQKPDLLLANNCAVTVSCVPGTVAVLLGNGNGTFRPAALYVSGGDGANSLAAADVNGDGKVDVVVSNFCRSTSNGDCGVGTGGVVGVLLGNGDGTLQPALVYPAGGYWGADSIAVADVNGDGRPDLLVVNIFGSSGLMGSVGVLLNTSLVGVVSPNTVNFGDVLVRDTSPQHRISLQNLGSSKITVSKISVSGDFALALNSCDKGVKPATHCDVYVTFTPPALGTHSGTLTFVDNATNSPQTVVLTGAGATTVATGTAITASAKQILAGQPITFTATVTSLGGGIIPDGEQVLFRSEQQGFIGYGTLKAGVASVTTSSLKFVGTRRPGGEDQKIVAQYRGDRTFYSSEGNTLIAIQRYGVSINMKSDPNPSTYCQPITFTADVTSKAPYPPTGVVMMFGDFLARVAPLQNGVGKRTSVMCPEPLGGPEYGRYEGDAYNDWGYSGLIQVIDPTTTTTRITSSEKTSPKGQPVKFSVVVKAPWAKVVYGSVAFKSGTKALGTVHLSEGTGSITVSSLPVGKNTVTATYIPANGKFLGSSASLVQTVQ